MNYRKNKRGKKIKLDSIYRICFVVASEYGNYVKCFGGYETKTTEYEDPQTEIIHKETYTNIIICNDYAFNNISWYFMNTNAQRYHVKEVLEDLNKNYNDHGKRKWFLEEVRYSSRPTPIPDDL